MCLILEVKLLWSSNEQFLIVVIGYERSVHGKEFAHPYLNRFMCPNLHTIHPVISDDDWKADFMFLSKISQPDRSIKTEMVHKNTDE